eukprot:scaffold2018_cov130-Amphora_coffeaeformis.AAC.1
MIRWNKDDERVMTVGHIGHPEMDTSAFLDPGKTKLYQSLIGALQWMVTIGQFNIMTVVVTMFQTLSMTGPEQCIELQKKCCPSMHLVVTYAM